jgi:hypothetical protein
MAFICSAHASAAVRSAEHKCEYDHAKFAGFVLLQVSAVLAEVADIKQRCSLTSRSTKNLFDAALRVGVYRLENSGIGKECKSDIEQS